MEGDLDLVSGVTEPRTSHFIAEASYEPRGHRHRVAARLGKPQSFENGQRRVDVREFTRIAEGIGLDPVDLFRQIVLRR